MLEVQDGVAAWVGGDVCTEAKATLSSRGAAGDGGRRGSPMEAYMKLSLEPTPWPADRYQYFHSPTSSRVLTTCAGWRREGGGGGGGGGEGSV